MRRFCDLKSEAYDTRLATGAKIKELELRGERLHYKLIAGNGPAEGWVSLSVKGQTLVKPTGSSTPKQTDSKATNLGVDKLLLRHETQGTFQDNYEQQKDLGAGGFAKVSVAKNIRTGEMRAVKMIECKTQKELTQIDAECRILVKLDHPHIMKFYEFFREPQLIYLVTELCTGGTFQNFFQFSMWDMEDARLLFKQVLSAIQHCHKMDVLHHDLKPDNCLILKDGGTPFAKVIDFGVSTMLKSKATTEGGEEGVKACSGTPFWRAPEVLDAEATSGKKADLYSIGLLMFVCLTGTHPLHLGGFLEPMGATEDDDMFDDIPEDVLDDEGVPKDAQALIMALLVKDKENRLDAKAALDHKWFAAPFANHADPKSPKSPTSKRVSYSGLSEVNYSPAGSPDASPKGSPSTSPCASPRGERSEIRLCQGGHDLNPFPTEEDDWSCSICEKDFPEGTTLYGCRTCDFDVCGECLKTLPLKKSGGRARMGNPVPAKTKPKRPNRRGSVRSHLLLERVLRYKDLDAWHCAILRLIAHNSDALEVSKQRERFEKMDTDHSGSLDQEELMAAMEGHDCVCTLAEMDEIMTALDSKGTGEIEYNEWIAATLQPGITTKEDIVRPVFDFFDVNREGKFGVSELKSVLGQQVALQMLRKAGTSEFTWETFMDLLAKVSVVTARQPSK